MHSSSALALLFFAALVPAQGRVFIGGVPSNMVLNLSSTAIALDVAAANAFYALMPVTNGWQSNSFDFAVFDGDLIMISQYGAGNWLRCTMVATHWAYLSNDACAHQPAPGIAVPQSVLMSNFDYGGVYPGMPGAPNLPWPGATMFSGGSWSFCRGQSTLTEERWQLRTRGYFPNEQWNACPPNGTITPNFNGWLIARFTFSFS